MKIRFVVLIGVVGVFLLSTKTGTAQEFTLTTTSANTVSSKSTIDLPALNGNPNAVIIATPIGGTETLNPHPIGAWYYNGKWNIFNTNHAAMPLGAKYSVQYFPQPSPSHFVHVIPSGSSATVSRTYLDYPSFDNKPSVVFKILQNHAPDHRAFYLNQSEARASYEGGKWFIQNVNGTALHAKTAYNVVIISTGTAGSPIELPNKGPFEKNPVPIPPNSNAGGDLSGNYPNPNVVGLNGRPLSQNAPTVGQMLRWNGTEWEPVTIGSGGTNLTPGLGLSLEGTTLNALSTTPMWNAGQLAGRDIVTAAPTTGQVLKWGGASWMPADDNVAAAAPPAAATPSASIETFFKHGTASTGFVPYQVVRPFPELTHAINITKKSRLLISGMVSVFGINCGPLGCPGSEGFLTLDINGIRKFHLAVAATANQRLAFTISNFMIDLEPGNYNVVFGLQNIQNQLIRGSATQSSVIVIPL